MATITPSWTENVNLHTSAVLSAGSTATDDIDIATEGYDAVAIVIEIAFGSTPDGDALVEILASSNSGTDDDTEPVTSFIIEAATSTTLRKTVVIKDLAYIAVAVTNQDTTDNVTYDSWYAGRQWDST